MGTLACLRRAGVVIAARKESKVINGAMVRVALRKTSAERWSILVGIANLHTVLIFVRCRRQQRLCVSSQDVVSPDVVEPSMQHFAGAVHDRAYGVPGR